MREPSDPSESPERRARAALTAVLETQRLRTPAMIVDAPPGAGKTEIIVMVAGLALGLLNERCMIVTQSNEQAFDLARRLARRFPSLAFVLLVRKRLLLDADVLALSNLRIVRSGRELPTDSYVVVANAAMWGNLRTDLPPFDLMAIDEAYQLADYRFLPIAGMAKRYLFVGDPGQIAPVVRGETREWRASPAGPHVACPRALLARHPEVPRIALPVSRRLPPDTVAIVQPAFYPAMPFIALSAPTDRALRAAAGSTSDLDRAIDLVAGGATIVQIELPRRLVARVDPGLADLVAILIRRLLEREVAVRDDSREQVLQPEQIGVVCPHIAQVAAVRERLGGGLGTILVETIDRYQGLERVIIVVQHPVSGLVEADSFHLDRGRLCVALSRHRVACILVGRAGIADTLNRYSPVGERVLGQTADEEYESWRAHQVVMDTLLRLGRVVQVP